jgi:hypothetical protein
VERMSQNGPPCFAGKRGRRALPKDTLAMSIHKLSIGQRRKRCQGYPHHRLWFIPLQRENRCLPPRQPAFSFCPRPVSKYAPKTKVASPYVSTFKFQNVCVSVCSSFG